MIEEALTAQLLASIPGITVYPLMPPENAKPPFVAYWQEDSSESEGFYTRTHTVTFLIDAIARTGIEPDDYRAAKELAAQVEDALGNGFEQSGVCVTNVAVTKRRDHTSTKAREIWTRTSYQLTYDTLI